MVAVGFVPAVVGKQAEGQTVRVAVFFHARATLSVIVTAFFRTNTFFYVRAGHILLLLILLCSTMSDIKQ